MCHFQVSSHTAGVFPFFCHRVLADYGPPIAAARPLICHGPLYRLLMLLPGPQCVMPYYVPPIAAARPLICHGPLYRLLMLLPGPQCLMGPCTASHCCCLHRHTPPCATFRS
ncbi:unnamed protein product, partial [Staurois parvus]